jgi:hypothetical protein
MRSVECRITGASSAETRFWEAPTASFFFMSQLLVVKTAHPQKLVSKSNAASLSEWIEFRL